MDTNVDISLMKRQIAEEVKEKYHLYRRIVSLEKEVDDLKNQIKQLTSPDTVSGDERSWT